MGSRLHALFERLWYDTGDRIPYLADLLLAPFLFAAALFFRVAVAVTHALYRAGILRAHRLPVPVISVGSLLVGGVGKTQVVIHIASLLESLGHRPVVVLRGYKGTRSRSGAIVSKGDGTAPLLSSAQGGDEAIEIARRLPRVGVAIGRDRVRAARDAISACTADVVVLDDGMQHLRLARDLDIAVWDAGVRLRSTNLLPRGPLREPLSALDRATMVFTIGQDPTRPPALPRPTLAVQLTGYTRLEELRDSTGSALTEPPKGATLITAIASPRRVVKSLGVAGVSVARVVSFPDHHRPTLGELSRLASGRGPFLVTEKDVVKLPAGWPPEGDVIIVVRAALSLLGPSGALLRSKLREIFAKPHA